ncbi:LysR family transcriptional regulator, partial [Staphylococcus aureus]|nr:LysR family transcriptional regulator [Staphylococcus aureus]
MHHDASLNIRQLQVFEAVARLESYIPAQQELGISVSALSHALSLLEGQPGFPLCPPGRCPSTPLPAPPTPPWTRSPAH